MVDNENVKNGEYNENRKCPIYCDFCDWLGNWENCPLVKETEK